MAVGWGALTATEQANLAADKPIIGANVTPVSPTTKQWCELGTTAGTDRTDGDYPARNAYDGALQYTTRSDGTTNTVSTDEETYLVYDLGKEVELDFLGYINNNFNTLGLKAVTAEIGTDGTFGTSYAVADFGAPADDKRKIDLDLRHTGSDPLRYTGVQYVRLKLVHDTTPFTPQLGELILGRRRQLERHPLRKGGYDSTSLHGESSLVKAKSGALSRQTYHSGAFGLRARFEPWQSPYVQDWIDWYTTDYGKRPFVWIANPSSAPNSWHLMMLEDSDFNFPHTGATKRDYELRAIEQGPERYYLAKGVN